MTWFKVDDTLATHPKARHAGLPAVGLWVVSGAYASQHLTEGYVPEWYVRTWPSGIKLAGQLVAAGLWKTTIRSGEKGWVFHQWDERNPSKEAVEELREANRVRQANHRAAKRAERLAEEERNAVTNGVTPPPSHGVTNGVSHSTPTRPDPTRPLVVPSGTTKKPEKTSSLDDEFEGFWKVYPRKVGKIAARKAYAKARKTATVQQMRSGLEVLVRAYAGQSLEFMPHPSTWLNEGRWDDDEQSIRPPEATPTNRRQAETDDLFTRALQRAQETDARNHQTRELEA